MASPSDLTTLLSRLAAAGVELIVVGGLAAVAQGAPIATFDLDVVHRRTVDNVDRLLALLGELGAHYRGRPGGPPMAPTREVLLGTGHSLLMTSLGPLDLLGAIEEGRDYPALLPDSVEIAVGGHPVRVLALAVILELKRASPHPKDQRVVAILEETLRRRG